MPRAEGQRTRTRRNPDAPAEEDHTGSSTASAGPTDRDAAAAASHHRELHPDTPFGEDDIYRIGELDSASQIAAELVADAIDWDAAEAEIAESEAAEAEAEPPYQPLILGAPSEHDTVRAQQAAQASRESVTRPGGGAPVGRFMEPHLHRELDYTDDDEGTAGGFIFEELSAPIRHQLVPWRRDRIYTRRGRNEDGTLRSHYHTAGTPAGPVLDGRIGDAAGSALEIGWSGDPPSREDARAPLLPAVALHPRIAARRQVVDTGLHQTRLGQVDYAGGEGSTLPTYYAAIRRDRDARRARREATKRRKQAITNLAEGWSARDPHGWGGGGGPPPPPPPPPPAGGDPIEAN